MYFNQVYKYIKQEKSNFFFLQVPLFKHWEDAAVQSLIKSIQQDGPIVTLAPSDSVIAMAGDPVDEIVIIIKGRFVSKF